MPNLNHNSNQPSDFLQGQQPIVTLADAEGNTLPCYVEKSITLDDPGQEPGREYLLLLPVAAPIEIFICQDDDTLADIEDGDIDVLFPSASAVLAELNLTLQRSAYTLTAVGNIPEAEDDNCFALEVDDDGTTDNFQMLVQFFHLEQRYVACTPLEPLLFFAYRELDAETVTLLSPEEFEQLQPQIEDRLFEGMDD